MNTKADAKQKVCEAIESRHEEIVAIGERIWQNPETGFREVKTARLTAEVLASLELPFTEGLALTGVRADLRSGRPGPTLALLGELDALLVPAHPDADPETGAVHACGHHAQVAGMLGCAMGMKDAGIMDELCGNLAFIAVPAEEFLEVGYRLSLVREGKIVYCGGKPEMIRLGVFDDVDLAMMIHTSDRTGLATSMNGFIMKKVVLGGKAAHAGMSPDEGINALYASELALAGINAQRETFRDDDAVRVHGIITNGGRAVNVIPEQVDLEIQVRAKTAAAILDASAKVDRAVKAGAMAMGGRARIETVPGYMPLVNHTALADVFREHLPRLEPGLSAEDGGHRGSSTDMGDVSQIIPSIHPYLAGSTGAAHTAAYRIEDKEKAYIWPAKMLAMCAVELLHGDGARGRAAAAQKPPMTRETYLQSLAAMSGTQDVSFSD